MRGSRLGLVLMAAAACLAQSCNTYSLSNFQARLDDDFSGGCLVRESESVYLLGLRPTAGPENVHVRLHDIDDSPDVFLLTTHSVPGVPIKIAKCLNEHGQLRKLAVITSDGMVHVIEHPGGGVTTLGDSGMFAVAGVEFAAGSAEGRKNVVVYGEGGGPFSAVKIFRDEGDGTYTIAGFPAGLTSVTSLALLDADADNDEDLVLGLGAGANNLRTYFYDGASTYTSGPVYQFSETITALASEDLDGDGVRDVVVASSSLVQSVVNVLRNNSDGTLTHTDTENTGAGPTRIAFGDLNLDGQPDAGIVNGTDDTVTILFGASGAAFDGSSTHVLPDGVADIAFSDLSPGDYPFVDLAVFSTFEDVGVLILGDGQDLLSEQLGRLPSSNQVVSIAIANFDSSPDGLSEIAALAVPSSTGSQPYDLQVHWWDGANDTFGPSDPPLSLSATGPLAVGDLDGVNGPDLAAPSPAGGVNVMLNDGSGAFSLATQTIDTGFFTPVGIALTPIDGNLSLDAAVSYGGTLGVWFNNGDGSFTPGPSVAEPATTMAIGYDEDLTARLALVHTALTIINVYTFLADGTPTTTDSVDIAPIEDITSMASGDWDGDGDDDFVAISNDDPSRPVYIVVLENTGAGQFSASTIFTGQRADGWDIINATITDLEGDGPGEIVFTNSGFNPQDQFLGVISQSRARGAKEIEPIESYLSGTPSGGVGVVELSGDGRPWVVTGKSGGLTGVSALPTRIAIVASGCNAADLAEPFGTLNFTDVLAFLTAFGSQDPAADLAEPMGTFDFSDVIAFLAAFGGGCP